MQPPTTLASAIPVRPVRVEQASATRRVAAMIVTWNRKRAADAVLRALSRLDYPLAALDVIVADNGSTDGTAGEIERAWRPDRVVDNPTDEADKPGFSVGVSGERGEAVHPFGSMTLVRNAHNLGGCGGFNTALAVAEHIDRGDAKWLARASALDFVWFVDDDVDLPANALSQLVRTAESDGRIGLVGSRTVDFDDRETTIETTIYFDFERGWMGPEPTPGHRLAASHRAWAEGMGGTRGKLPFTGVREVDVVSACSLLARWSAVRKVGFWDRRFFIYCDDADWCLRFARAGFRVVCDLDAVVYHTHWLAKLTPARGYYASRNLLWMIEKQFAGPALKRAMLRRLMSLLRESRKAAMHCRLFHAEIIRRSAADAMEGRGGKLDDEGPKPVAVLEAFERAGALRSGAEVLVMCSHAESIGWADALRERVSAALIKLSRPMDQPRWTYMVRGTVADEPGAGSGAGASARPERIVFEPRRRSKFRAQRRYLRRPATAVVIFNQHNDFPLLRSRCNIHIDTRRAEVAQVEPDGPRVRLAFLRRWLRTALAAAGFAARARAYSSDGKYG
ncbi:MAG: glycosyltransferase family 2 protein [Phycisphaerales bacterium]